MTAAQIAERRVALKVAVRRAEAGRPPRPTTRLVRCEADHRDGGVCLTRTPADQPCRNQGQHA